jgi:hypothetical protein
MLYLPAVLTLTNRNVTVGDGWMLTMHEGSLLSGHDIRCGWWTSVVEARQRSGKTSMGKMVSAGFTANQPVNLICVGKAV